MKNTLLFLLLPVLCFSQNVNSYRFFSLLYSRGYPSNDRSNISFDGTFQGKLLFNNDSITSTFTVKNSFLVNDSTKIDLYDKNFKYLKLTGAEKKSLKLKRVSNGNYLKRILIDTLGFYAFDTNFNFNTKKVRKYQLLFSYDGKLYQIRQNIFRGFKGNFDRTIADIEIKDEELKKVIAKFYDSIENK